MHRNGLNFIGVLGEYGTILREYSPCALKYFLVGIFGDNAL